MRPIRHKFTILQQVMSILPIHLVQKLSRRFGVDKQARSFPPWSHVVSLVFAQISHALSLNDVCDSLRNHSSALSTFRGATTPRRNTLSHANRKRKHDFIISDDEILLDGAKSSKDYTERLRLIDAWIEVDGVETWMSFLTNNFDWSPASICELYNARWGIEVYFKEVKQTLQLADFLGHNENAVRWQIWTALLTYVLLRFIKYVHKWQSTFPRLFTLIRGVLWSRLNLKSVLNICCGTASDPPRVLAQPQLLYLPIFT